MDFEAKDPAGVVTVLGWVQFVKVVIPESWKRWLPLVAIASGLLYSFGIRGSRGLFETVSAGLMIGLSASGVFSAARKVYGVDAKDDAQKPITLPQPDTITPKPPGA